MCCLLFSELSACLLFVCFFNLILSPVFDLYSDGGGDSVCVPGAITAFLPAGQWPDRRHASCSSHQGCEHHVEVLS